MNWKLKCCCFAFEVTVYYGPWAGPSQKISCVLAYASRAGRFLVSSGRAGLQQCWPVPSLKHSMGRSMELEMKDNIVNSLFLCATLTNRRRGHTAFVQAGAALVRKRLSRTHFTVGRAIPGEWVPVSGMKVWSLVVFSNHSAIHRWSSQNIARMLLSSDELINCAVSLNGYLDLRCRAFPPGRQVSAEWSRCPGSMTRRARDCVAPRATQAYTSIKAAFVVPARGLQYF